MTLSRIRFTKGFPCRPPSRVHGRHTSRSKSTRIWSTCDLQPAGLVMEVGVQRVCRDCKLWPGGPSLDLVGHEVLRTGQCATSRTHAPRRSECPRRNSAAKESLRNKMTVLVSSGLDAAVTRLGDRARTLFDDRCSCADAGSCDAKICCGHR